MTLEKAQKYMSQIWMEMEQKALEIYNTPSVSNLSFASLKEMCDSDAISDKIISNIDFSDQETLKGIISGFVFRSIYLMVLSDDYMTNVKENPLNEHPSEELIKSLLSNPDVLQSLKKIADMLPQEIVDEYQNLLTKTEFQSKEENNDPPNNIDDTFKKMKDKYGLN